MASRFRKVDLEAEPLSGRKLRERALDLLSRRDHSEQELARKLREKGGVTEEIPSLLDSLREMGYLDDGRFAENFIRYRASKTWGRRRYRQELLKRGVDGNLADRALSESADLTAEAVREKLRRFIERELAKEKPEDKIVASLLRRGFAPGPVRQILGEVSRGDSDSPEPCF